MQTGSRKLLNLTVQTKGSQGPNFTNGFQVSQLFGQALQVPAYCALYVDVDDESLRFTGNSSVVGPFTMGAFIWGQSNHNVFWWLINDHKANFVGDIYYSYTFWRLGLLLDAAYYMSLSYTKADASAADWTSFGASVPTNLRTGWIHLAFTYDPAEVGGTLRGFINGVQYFFQANLTLLAYGPTGACVHLCFNFRNHLGDSLTSRHIIQIY